MFIKQAKREVGSSSSAKLTQFPIAAAKQIAERFDYDQVVIIARKVGVGEHCTTYGKDKANCAAAARIGDFLKFKVMGWIAKESEATK